MQQPTQTLEHADAWYQTFFEVVGKYDEELIASGVIIFVILMAMKFLLPKLGQTARRLLAWQAAAGGVFLVNELGVAQIQFLPGEPPETFGGKVMLYLLGMAWMLMGVGVVGIALKLGAKKWPALADLL